MPRLPKDVRSPVISPVTGLASGTFGNPDAEGVACLQCEDDGIAWFINWAERYAWMDRHHAATGHLWAYMQPYYADGEQMRNGFRDNS